MSINVPESSTLLVVTGDYFGILMDARVTGFPFNICSDPMYVGSTLNFVAEALRYVPV